MDVSLVRNDARDGLAVQHQVVGRCLDDVEVLLAKQHAANRVPIEFAVCLRTCRAHCSAFRGIQRAKLDARPVDGACHGAAQRIDLFRQVPFSDTANRRIAAHLAERRDAVRNEQGTGTRPRGSETRFRTGMTAADHYYVIRGH